MRRAAELLARFRDAGRYANFLEILEVLDIFGIAELSVLMYTNG